MRDEKLEHALGNLGSLVGVGGVLAATAGIMPPLAAVVGLAGAGLSAVTLLSKLKRVQKKKALSPMARTGTDGQ